MLHQILKGFTEKQYVAENVFRGTRTFKNMKKRLI